MKRMISVLIALTALTLLKAQDTTLSEYTGTYKFPEGSVVTSVDVKLENGVLTASSSQGASPLERISKDTFNLVAYNGTVYFSRDADKKVNAIRIEVQDTILEGKKDSSGVAVRQNTYATWRKESLW